LDDKLKIVTHTTIYSKYAIQ